MKQGEGVNLGTGIQFKISVHGKLVWKERLHSARALSLCTCIPLCYMTAPWGKSPMNLTWEMLPKVILLTAGS